MHEIRGAFLLLIALLSLMSGCNEKEPSQMVTLYMGSVANGKSIINLVDYHDPNGVQALGFCEDLKNLYEKRWREKYYCASFQYKEYLPDVKWTLAK